MVKVPKDLTKLSDEALQELWERTAADALEAREENRRVVEEVHERDTRRAAQEKFDSLSEPEKAALATLVSTVGIESKESVNG
jgi:hypothetical protein